MIPLRVKVQGFLSYRDEATLEFEGASLWMLTGANGAGKSAIFDAVTFALYGAHRGGKQNADKLINHECDQLIVEFDFCLDRDIYRARRTEHRHQASTRQIVHLSGPNPPPRGGTASTMVPETDTRAGFDNWIAEQIGLSYEAFKASVLLRQGESDALLKMDGAKRHELLTQLVDLSRYVRLAERAEGKRKHYAEREEIVADRLTQIPVVDVTTLAELKETIEKHQQVFEEAQKDLQHIASLKVHAEHWQASKTKLTKI